MGSTTAVSLTAAQNHGERHKEHHAEWTGMIHSNEVIPMLVYGMVSNSCLVLRWILSSVLSLLVKRYGARHATAASHNFIRTTLSSRRCCLSLLTHVDCRAVLPSLAAEANSAFCITSIISLRSLSSE